MINQINPRISVIIPIYNKENCILNTLNSVHNQTYTNFELIIIDGGSTDKSLEIIKDYNDTRLTIYAQTGKGVSSARNEGVSYAKGELIAFLDADDEWKPNYLQTIWELYQKYPDAGIYATAYEIQTETYKTEIK